MSWIFPRDALHYRYIDFIIMIDTTQALAPACKDFSGSSRVCEHQRQSWRGIRSQVSNDNTSPASLIPKMDINDRPHT